MLGVSNKFILSFACRHYQAGAWEREKRQQYKLRLILLEYDCFSVGVIFCRVNLVFYLMVIFIYYYSLTLYELPSGRWELRNTKNLR